MSKAPNPYGPFLSRVTREVMRNSLPMLEPDDLRALQHEIGEMLAKVKPDRVIESTTLTFRHPPQRPTGRMDFIPPKKSVRAKKGARK